MIAILVIITQGCMHRVERDTLEAFKDISKGIERTIELTEERDAYVMKRINAFPDDSLGMVIKLKSAKANKAAEGLMAFIQELKKQVLEQEGVQTYDQYRETGRLANSMNMESSNAILLDSIGGKRPLGSVLKDSINHLQHYLVHLFEGLPKVDEDYLQTLDSLMILKVEDKFDNRKQRVVPWAESTFGNIPLGAVVALLTKFQNDVKNAESLVLTELLKIGLEYQSGKDLEVESVVSEGRVYISVEKMPIPPGGVRAFNKWLGETIVYPHLEREMGIEGKVFVQFIVEINGSLSGIKIYPGTEERNTNNLNQAALDVLARSPKWTPGVQGLEKVRVQYNQPVVFKVK